MACSGWGARCWGVIVRRSAKAGDFARPVEDCEGAIGATVHAHARGDETAALGRGRDLQDTALKTHAIGVADDALFLVTEDVGEIARIRDEMAVCAGRRTCELGVVGSDIVVAQPGVGGLDRVEPGEPHLLRQAPLQRAKHPLHPPAPLRLVGGNAGDPQPQQGPPDLGPFILVDRLAGLRGVEIMPAAICVER